MGMTDRELGDVLASTLPALVAGLGGLLALSGLWVVGMPLVLATIGWFIWYSRGKAHREADEAIARAAAYDADEHGQADDTRP